LPPALGGLDPNASTTTTTNNNNHVATTNGPEEHGAAAEGTSISNINTTPDSSGRDGHHGAPN